MKRWFLAAAYLLSFGAIAFGQWQTPIHSVPVGVGVGVSGFSSVGPCAAGQTAVWADSVSDPTCYGGVVSAQTSNYTLATSDCGKVVTLGGSVFSTLTVNAASGFSSYCRVTVANADTGRGKKMAVNGVTFPNNSILWPGQAFDLVGNGSSWVLVNVPGRWKLTASATFNVDSAGSNTNDGLATGAAGALQTIQGAINLASQVIDPDGTYQFIVLPKCAGGPPVTYSETLQLKEIVGAPRGGSVQTGVNPRLRGDTTTPTNCILSGGVPATILAGPNISHDWVIEGFQLKNSAAPCLYAHANTWVRVGNVDFNDCFGAAGSAQVQIDSGAKAEFQTNFSISTSALTFASTGTAGQLFVAGVQITLSNTPGYNFAFTYATTASFQDWTGTTFVGTGASAATKKYFAEYGAGISLNGAALPGGVAGSLGGGTFGWCQGTGC